MDQLFHHIDPTNPFEKLKNELNKGKMDALLKKWSTASNNYFDNKKQLLEEEEKIYGEIKGIKDIFNSVLE